ncbi:helix-turn-helix domain-containing protein [Rufibacter latericius]|uniref:AraC family transcriptional regulator n=1 Tax=Rufibacter latericius TaxID=2487040 RepID=A0A3M9MAV4_9BACT|nr:helix-turn-helix domain-containing protein [Rufibacter latericius]RNI22664.1 AraC family transcriptional regulator [Rufibacter latericius]
MDKTFDSQTSNFNAVLKLKGFMVYEINSGSDSGHTYSRKDFYKINLTTGKFIFHYADKSVETDETFLLCANPHIPYSCEAVSPHFSGYTCLFTEEFLSLGERSDSFRQSPLFKIGGTPVLRLDKEQKEFITGVFKRMLAEQSTDYVFKDELIRNYIHLIIHEAVKMQPSENYSTQKSAAERITSVFLELLERQFPIESTERPLELKTAQDYANGLSVHVNYLNSAVKKVTGKPTTAHIADRIINEAKALLLYTDWSISQIAYALGFEYPTYFNNFFKKKTGEIPKSIRTTHL